MMDEWPYYAGRDAYFAGTPIYDDYEDECLWVDGWDDAARNIPSPEITLPTFDGPPNFNLVEEN